MRPRLIAAFFLLFFGASWIAFDIVTEGGQADWHMAAAVVLMLVGAVFTDPKELAPALQVTVNVLTPLIPWARRKSVAVPKVVEVPEVPSQQE